MGLEDTSRGAGGFGSTGINMVEEIKVDSVVVEQQWPYEAPRWEQEEGRVTLCAGKTHHICPGGWKWIYLPWKLSGNGWFFVVGAFNRPRMVATLGMSKNKHLKV